MNNLSVQQLLWIAGIVDSEGSIFIGKTKPRGKMKSCNYSLEVVISNTSKKIIDQIFSYCQIGLTSKKYNASKKDCLFWRCTDRKALLFLKTIRPFLIQKSDQADIGIRFGEGKITVNKKQGCSEIQIFNRERDYNLLKTMKEKNIRTDLDKHKDKASFLIWLAGLFDGDGCICIKKSKNDKYRIECTIICDYESIVDYISNFLGFGYKCKQKMKSGLHMFTWSCSGFNCGKFLPSILDNLSYKKEQARLGIEFCKLLVGRWPVPVVENNKSRHELYVRIKEEKCLI